MIETEEMKVAENEEEEFWERARQNTEQQLKEMEKALKFQKASLEMIEEKLKEAKPKE